MLSLESIYMVGQQHHLLYKNALAAFQGLALYMKSFLRHILTICTSTAFSFSCSLKFAFIKALGSMTCATQLDNSPAIPQ